MRIVQAEVAADDRDWQRNDQHATDSTCATDDFSRPRLRGKVTVTYGCHGNEAPPEWLWNGSELGVFVDHDFNVVNYAREHDNWDEENQQEKNQLMWTCLQCVNHDL